MLVKWKKYQVTWDIYTKSAQTVYIQFEIIWGRKRRLKLQNKTTPNTKDYFIAFEIPILLLFNSWVLHSQEQSLWFWLAIRATTLLNLSCSSFMHWSVQLTHKNITAHWLNKQARKLARINNCPSYIKKAHHLASRPNNPHLCWFARSRIKTIHQRKIEKPKQAKTVLHTGALGWCHLLSTLLQGGQIHWLASWFSHKISIQSALGLYSSFHRT